MLVFARARLCSRRSVGFAVFFRVFPFFFDDSFSLPIFVVVVKVRNYEVLKKLARLYLGRLRGSVSNRFPPFFRLLCLFLEDYCVFVFAADCPNTFCFQFLALSSFASLVRLLPLRFSPSVSCSLQPGAAASDRDGDLGHGRAEATASHDGLHRTRGQREGRGDRRQGRGGVQHREGKSSEGIASIVICRADSCSNNAPRSSSTTRRRRSKWSCSGRSRARTC